MKYYKWRIRGTTIHGWKRYTHWFVMNSKMRVFYAIFGRSEVPRDGFYINRIRKITFISKRLAENFYNRAKVLQFLPNLKGKVVWSLPSTIWPGSSYSTPCMTSSILTSTSIPNKWIILRTNKKPTWFHAKCFLWCIKNNLMLTGGGI